MFSSRGRAPKQSKTSFQNRSTCISATFSSAFGGFTANCLRFQPCGGSGSVPDIPSAGNIPEVQFYPQGRDESLKGIITPDVQHTAVSGSYDYILKKGGGLNKKYDSCILGSWEYLGFITNLTLVTIVKF
jgi:hypothetical protein